MRSLNDSSDYSNTPEVALKPLLPYLLKSWVIWECAEGSGNITRFLAAAGYRIIGSDIQKGSDFLSWQPDLEYNCIVTNPPYSLMPEFLERAYNLRKPFAFILPLSAFRTGKRQDLFNTHGLEVIFFDKRINFETPSGKKISTPVAWFTNWLNIGRQMTFTKI